MRFREPLPALPQGWTEKAIYYIEPDGITVRTETKGRRAHLCYLTRKQLEQALSAIKGAQGN